MKISAIALWTVTLFLGIRVSAQVGVIAPVIPQPISPSSAPRPAFMNTPGWLGQEYFVQDKFAKLEALVAEYQKSDTRIADGRHALYLLTAELSNSLRRSDSLEDQHTAEKLATWHEQFPQSALQPIVAAMQMYQTAWRARGSGHDSNVTEEGLQIFHERNLSALKILMDNKKRSSTLPTWYEYAMFVSRDLGMPEEASRELFDEGIRKFPGYYGIYFAYAQQLSPSWGGSWEAADAFIVEQTAAKSNKLGEILYMRLYAYIDKSSGQTPAFIRDSMVSWPRMRRGFEELLAAYPDGWRAHANFAAFACRMKDATTYAKLRPKIVFTEFADVAPEGISIEVCDRRFMKKA